MRTRKILGIETMKYIIAIGMAVLMMSGCQGTSGTSTASVVNPTVCELTDQEKRTIGSINQQQLIAKYGHCDLSSFESVNPALTPETVELINKQVAFELGLLGYNKRLLEDPVLTENIKGFQRSLGEPESGRLTQKQLIKANEIASKKTYVSVRMPLSGNGVKPYVWLESDNLRFAGTWQVEGETLEGPYKISDSKFNYWDFECDKKIRTCKSTHVNIGVSDEVVGIGQFENNSFDILSWESDKVVLTYDTLTDESCRKAVITVDLRLGTVQRLATQQNRCRGIADLPAPRIANLVSSWEHAKKLNAHRLEQTLSAFTEDYMKLKAAAIQPPK